MNQPRLDFQIDLELFIKVKAKDKISKNEVN